MDSLNTWRKMRDYLNSLDDSDKRLDCSIVTYVVADGSNLLSELREFEGQDEFIEDGDLFIMAQ